MTLTLTTYFALGNMDSGQNTDVTVRLNILFSQKKKNTF